MNLNMPIGGFLNNHAKKDTVSFHMPGHKGSSLYKRFHLDDFLGNLVNWDVTEIKGADNLFQAEGIIREVEEQYANLYNVEKSYLLINGTSGGIIAAILASVPKGKKLIMARNCHKSVFNALTLADIQPVYAYPELNEEFGISGAISPEEIETLLKENPEAEAVILPSPNYYGICSDIESIAKVVHKYHKVLIVDQAHGAHLSMFRKYGDHGLPMSAEEAGADIVINSIHKTLASFTQSAVLNLNSNRVKPFLLEDKLQCIQSTSPSYILMASLDANAYLMREHGQQLMEEWAESLDYFYKEAREIKGLKFIDKIPGMDWTKINISFDAFGITGDELEKILMEKYNIYIELFTGDLVMCMTGVGNRKEDYQKLLKALNEISMSNLDSPKKGLGDHLEREALHKKAAQGVAQGPTKAKRPDLYPIPRTRKQIPLEEADGLICASSIIPYPPGIPFVCPGEKIDRDAIEYIKSLREKGEKVIGINEQGEVFVGAD
ncbi:MAG: aminotransferase class I/II-fold pyridoxal phosphate-dependent enzyme [Anaerovoracaceae bacterium]|jgi:arginine/lysine/ornithine decarboxylase